MSRWSHIHCPSAKRLADNGTHRGKAATHKVNGVTRDDKKCSTTKMMNGDHGSSHTSKGMLAMKLAAKYFIILIFIAITTASAKYCAWTPS